MKLVLKRVEDLIPYERNPRNNDDAVDAVAESIRQCSYIQPIVVDENMVVLAGHTRLKALKKLGVDECKCLVVSGLTEEQKKKYRFLDNKTGEAALWDVEKLNKEIEGLDFGELDFFNLTNQTFEINVKTDRVGVTEFDTGGFGDEQFSYVCPCCGFRFNA